MKKSSPHLLVSALGSLLWLVIVSMAYVYTHKAFSAEMLLALLSFFGEDFLIFRGNQPVRRAGIKTDQAPER